MLAKGFDEICLKKSEMKTKWYRPLNPCRDFRKFELLGPNSLYIQGKLSAIKKMYINKENFHAQPACSTLQ
jgi:hypothetical protein